MAPVTIVSGGTYGIGRAITLRLASAGHDVVAFGLDGRQEGSRAENGSAETQAALDAAGCAAELMVADVSEAADVDRVVAVALDRFGRVDGIVNNAAIRVEGSAVDVPLPAFDRTLAVNLRGPLLLARAAVPHMRLHGRGRIVNIGSASAWGRPGLAAYVTSKAGLVGLTMALAMDLQPDGITANLVVPGRAVPSGMTREMGLFDAHERTSADAAAEDLAKTVAFLMSDDAAGITGAIIDVGAPTVRFGRRP